MPETLIRVTVRYKSGQSVTFVARKFSITWDKTDSHATHAEWDIVGNQPWPLMIGLHNIESVWQEPV